MNFDDEDENGAGSQDSGSENDADEIMEDVDDGDADADADADGDGDGDEGDEDGDDGDGDDDDGNGDNDDDDQEEPVSPSQRPRSLPNGSSAMPGPLRTDTNPTVTLTSPSPRAAELAGGLPFRPSVRPEALNALVYDIIPTIAAPHSTSINAVTATPDMRWVFSGGADGYIRKFNWIDTANGKLALTVAQRHPFVDSVTKAGVLLSYWENDDSDRNEATSLSPVYSLAVHHQSLWLLSGLESGGINLQSVRHEEGKRIHTLRQHTSAVSVLTLAQDETSVLSGSWDKTINDWDLNTGQVKRRFETSNGQQISAIEQRPMSTLPIPQDTDIVPVSNGTFSSNNAARPQANGLSNGVGPSSRPSAVEANGNEDAAGSPEDSLFGDKDSLFGDDKDPSNGPSGLAPFGDDEEDEFSRAIANGIQQADEDANAGMDMMDLGGPVQAPAREQSPEALKESLGTTQTETLPNGVSEAQSSALVNGLPHSEEVSGSAGTNSMQAEQPASSETTFFDAAIDGTVRIWDRRQSNPIARIAPPRNTPPWCMNACWSPDGNFIYAGRRNGTVDEYSLHKSLREPRRTFKFPGVSGAVSAVRAMPNGRHLVCASYDILRLYDLHEQENKNLAVPFWIVPGHRTGVVSQLYLDPTCQFMISTGGNRGWEGSTTEVLLGYEIGIPS
ncbi:Transcription factor spt8 [Didymosphaeria variabile]|uniref:Transcription factor spt8 n=1 Tax=Didymosphaeria variabile TaxID=1932322 RepID=A0A9W8XQD4_9PLEO|nr:Transcription factor spt8 [Didymosphaeria variabile]KAJ4356659.1 Transcription factor spt8 [Didymosphaeria variabile]